MPAYPFNPSYLTWCPPPPNARHAGSFRPQGHLVDIGKSLHFNPSAWASKKTVSARLIVGFNVGGTPKWTLDDLVKLVGRVRTKQTGNPSASFVAQKGIYQHRDSKHVVYEDGAQVFIIQESGTLRTFNAQMMKLAETIYRDLKQETVILEIQINGVSQGVQGITA